MIISDLNYLEIVSETDIIGGEAAPSCVIASVDTGIVSQTATVTNTCSTPERLKVVWAFDLDSACEQTYPGTTFSSTRARFPSRFDGVEVC